MKRTNFYVFNKYFFYLFICLFYFYKFFKFFTSLVKEILNSVIG